MGSFKAILTVVLLGITTTFAQDAPYRIDPNIDFSKYKTYAWSHTDHQVNTVDPEIVKALDTELSKKNLKKTDSGPGDLSLCYHSNFGTEKFRRYTNQSDNAHTFTIKTGEVAFDAYDSSTKELIWHRTVSINPKAEPQHITKAASKLLEKYPATNK
jgi:hypothetical protein